MKKSLIFAAIAAVALSACAKFETFTNTDSDNAVSFGVYAGKTAQTRATYGDITTATLKTSTDGFGVFAYYTEAAAWSASATPNFMYNQQVTYSAEANTTLYPQKWVYSPRKYWPNGTNSTTVESGETADKLSFFAYAPHIATASINSVPAAGQGITAMSANSATGAPTVSFTVPAKAEHQIDLLWAIPVKDQTKAELDGTVSFTFKHALTKLNVKVQAVVDATAPTTANLDAATSIILTSLKVEADDTKSGVLTLDSTDADAPNWGSKSGKTEVTYDNTSFSSTTIVNSKTGFNVTETATDLNATLTPMIIPGTIDFDSDKFLVITADYWVLTADSAVNGGYSAVRQVIQKTSTADVTFAAGKKYDILVKIGLNSVDFDVTVTDWGDGTPDPAVDLPANVA